jgi:hypothetical protein
LSLSCLKAAVTCIVSKLEPEMPLGTKMLVSWIQGGPGCTVDYGTVIGGNTDMSTGQEKMLNSISTTKNYIQIKQVPAQKNYTGRVIHATIFDVIHLGTFRNVGSFTHAFV